jgi:AraC-like DNA-binding protein
MRFPTEGHPFFGFFPPYRTLEVLAHPRQFPQSPLPSRGFALIWNLVAGEWTADALTVRRRPPGVALIVVLPPASDLERRRRELHMVEQCRPHSVLPFMEELEPEELVAILRRFPSELPVEVTEYLTWRGIDLDLDTRRLLRRTLELSAEIRTVAGLARAFYMSRRALGRRLLTRGLPVPSHWLHFGRVLRACIRLQDPAANLFSIGCDLGYPDGFALSNQMRRLTGLRPSLMKSCYGWEWILETWLAVESESGHLSPELRRALFGMDRPDPEQSAAALTVGTDSPTGSSLRVAEDKHWAPPHRPKIHHS